MKTLDNRYVRVYVETTATDRLLVHDGGDATAELFLQGLTLTDSRVQTLRNVAKRYGASYANNSFVIAATHGALNESVLAIAQCSIAGMHDILKHAPNFDEERVDTLVKKALQRNPPPNMTVQFGVVAKGGGAREHKFDAVAFPLVRDLSTVAVKTLGTAYPPNVQTERFGYIALNLRGTLYDNWRKLTVIARAELWPFEHLRAVRDLSHLTIELRTGDEDQIAERLLPAISDLAA